MKKIKLCSILSVLVMTLFIISGFMIQAPTDKISVTATAKTITVDNKNYEVKYTYLDAMSEYYSDFINYCEELNLSAQEIISFEEFCDGFYAQDEFNILEYTEYFKSTVNNISEADFIDISPTSGGGLKELWQVNIGTSLPKMPVYESFTFNLYSGDILYEEEGFSIPAYSGHTAIIEGQFNDAKYGNYWRVIEAVMGPGVVRSVLDDDRFIERKGHILTVPSSNIEQRQGAVNFCIWRLGDEYFPNPFQQPTDHIPIAWQCSALVWRAYYEQGINFKPSTGGVLPKHIFGSSLTSEVVIERFAAWHRTQNGKLQNGLPTRFTGQFIESGDVAYDPDGYYYNVYDFVNKELPFWGVRIENGYLVEIPNYSDSYGNWSNYRLYLSLVQQYY